MKTLHFIPLVKTLAAASLVKFPRFASMDSVVIHRAASPLKSSIMGNARQFSVHRKDGIFDYCSSKKGESR